MLSGLIAFTAIHLLVLGLYFFYNKKAGSSRWIGAFFLVLALIQGMQLAYNQKWVYDYRYLNNTDYIYGSLLGVLFHLYICQMLNTKPSKWFLYVQAFVSSCTVLHFIWFELSFPTQNQLIAYLDAAYIELPFEKKLLNLLLFLNLNVGIIASYFTYRSSKKTIETFYADSLLSQKLKWLGQIILVVFIFNNILMPIFLALPQTFYFQSISPIFFSATYMLVFIKALKQPTVFLPTESLKEELSPTDTTVKNPEEYLALFGRIESCMKEQKPYLHVGFSIFELSELLGEKKQTVSRTINNCSEDNFFGYVNRYRIAEAKRLLSVEENTVKYTIEGIGKQCGFGAKSSFFTTFKKYEGCSPQEYSARVGVVN